MDRGRVYQWSNEPGAGAYGRLKTEIVPLPRLDHQHGRSKTLAGKHVRVVNGIELRPEHLASVATASSFIGNAEPDAAGDFLFEPARGGGRLDKTDIPAPDFVARYVEAAKFGETNTYFHLDRIAAYIDSLLSELDAASLPPVTAVVNAHHAVTEWDGIRDGVNRANKWRPFQGGHYRLPSKRRGEIAEPTTIAPNGEIHLGPGFKLLRDGALVQATGSRYRANASHNAGILYHEYGHHITRHTADFCANFLRPRHDQSNRKTAIDEGTCDYWAAAMLGTPHIWILHRSHEPEAIHARSLTSQKTMANYDQSPTADPHFNGTIWGAALWHLRSLLAATRLGGARYVDLLLLKSLLLIGTLPGPVEATSIGRVRRARNSFATGLTALLFADELLDAGKQQSAILDVFSERGITPCMRTSFDQRPEPTAHDAPANGLDCGTM